MRGSVAAPRPQPHLMVAGDPYHTEKARHKLAPCCHNSCTSISNVTCAGGVGRLGVRACHTVRRHAWHTHTHTQIHRLTSWYACACTAAASRIQPATKSTSSLNAVSLRDCSQAMLAPPGASTCRSDTASNRRAEPTCSRDSIFEARDGNVDGSNTRMDSFDTVDSSQDGGGCASKASMARRRAPSWAATSSSSAVHASLRHPDVRFNSVRAVS